jgi:hypothetical protein
MIALSILFLGGAQLLMVYTQSQAGSLPVADCQLAKA